MLLTGIDRYKAEAMKELDSERDDLLLQLSIESSLESTVSQLINPLEQMFGFLPEKKQVAVMKAIGSEGWKTFTGRKTLKTPRMWWKFQSHNTV
ncbi:MAG: hypothetical protein ACPHL9_02515 [Limisphaerales bacterium]